MKNKQTAVEWLKFEIDSIEFQDPAAGQLYLEIQSLIEQAKEMEKEQIIKFCNEYGTYLLKGGTMSAASYNELKKLRDEK